MSKLRKIIFIHRSIVYGSRREIEDSVDVGYHMPFGGSTDSKMETSLAKSLLGGHGIFAQKEK